MSQKSILVLHLSDDDSDCPTQTPSTSYELHQRIPLILTPGSISCTPAASKNVAGITSVVAKSDMPADSNPDYLLFPKTPCGAYRSTANESSPGISLNMPNSTASQLSDHMHGIAKSSVLADTVVYVDVRSGSENRSNAIAYVLRLLGATVVDKLDNSVTHVVFKDGHKRTINFASRRAEVKLVSVLWVDSCKQTMQKADETLFPVTTPDARPTPTGALRPKPQRFRSMQPKEFDEEYLNSPIGAGSDAKSDRRKRRSQTEIQMDRYRVKDTPAAAMVGAARRAKYFVADTEPISEDDSDGELLTPMSAIRVPETPPSMRRWLERKQTPLAAGVSSSEDESTSDSERVMCVETATTPSARLTSNDDVIVQRILFDPPVDSVNEVATSLNPITNPTSARINGIRPESDSQKSALTYNGTQKTPAARPLVRRVAFRVSSDIINIPRSSYFNDTNGSGEVVQAEDKVSEAPPCATNSQPVINNELPSKVFFTPLVAFNNIRLPLAVSRSVSDTGKSNGDKNSSNDSLRSNGSSSIGQKRGNSSPTVSDATLPPSKRRRSRCSPTAAAASEQSKPANSDCKQTSLVSFAQLSQLVASASPSHDTISTKPSSVLPMGEIVRCGGKGVSKDGVAERRRSTGVRRASIKSASNDTVSGNNLIMQYLTCDRSDVTSGVSIRDDDDDSRSMTYGSVAIDNGSCSQRVRSSAVQSSFKGLMAAAENRSLCALVSDTKDCGKNGVVSFDSPSGSRATNEHHRRGGNYFSGIISLSDLTQESSSDGKSSSEEDEIKKKFLTGKTSPTKHCEVRLPAAWDKSCSSPLSGVALSSAESTRSSRRSFGGSLPQSRVLAATDRKVSGRRSIAGISQHSRAGTCVSLVSPKQCIQNGVMVSGSAAVAMKSNSAGKTGSTDGNSSPAVRNKHEENSAGRVEKESGSTDPGSSGGNDNNNNNKVVRRRNSSNDFFIGKKSKKNKSKSHEHKKEECAGTGFGSGDVVNSERSVVTTSLHRREQENVAAAVQSLGGFVLSDIVTDSTRHIIAGDNRRTIKLLTGIARGCWILPYDWVTQSSRAGKWLPEEDFEMKEAFPTAQARRLVRREVTSSKKHGRLDLFSSISAIYVDSRSSPPSSTLEELVQLCGGRVTSCLRKAEVCVGKFLKQTLVNVSELWILDSIMANQQLPFDTYRLHE